MSPMSGLLLLILVAAPDRDALAEEYFGADEARRAAIRAELGPVDELTAKEVSRWRTRGWARRRRASRRPLMKKIASSCSRLSLKPKRKIWKSIS